MGGGGVFAVTDSEDDHAELEYHDADLEHAFKDGISGLFDDEVFDDNDEACLDFQ